ncbi:MAG: hypothetical protein ACQESX_01555, partial [Bacteroidota bacterium]
MKISNYSFLSVKPTENRISKSHVLYLNQPSKPTTTADPHSDALSSIPDIPDSVGLLHRVFRV